MLINSSEPTDSIENIFRENVEFIQTIKRFDLPQEIGQRIKQMIVSKYLNPGDFLPSEAKLCNIFKIGRSTVREAVKILKAENILEIKKGIGTFVVAKPGVVKDPLGVTLMNQQVALENLMETRLLIEPNITFLAAQRATMNNITKLEKIMFDTEKVIMEHKNHMEVDMAFHNTIAESTQNDIVFRIIPIINDSIIAGYNETYNMIGSFEKATRFHREVFDAIKSGRAGDAKNAMKCHLMQSMDDILLKQKIKKENEL
jgi:GntR family transcriptional repressor for pyruvate dehydrogenase complex